MIRRLLVTILILSTTRSLALSCGSNNTVSPSAQWHDEMLSIISSSSDSVVEVCFTAGTFTGDCGDGEINDKAVNISGAGANATFLDCNGSGRLILASGGSTPRGPVVIRDLSFTNGGDTVGLVYGTELVVTVVNVHASECHSSSRAGAIDIYGVDAALEVRSSTFERCSTGMDGGAVSAEKALVKIFHSHFTGCVSGLNYSPSSYQSDGGAVKLENGDLVMEGNTFVNNTSVNGNGGAVALDNPLTFSSAGDVFIGNSAYKDGGGLYNLDAVCVLEDGVFEGNSAGLSGGGLRMYSDVDTVVRRTRVVGNTAGDGAGGADLYALTNVIVSDSQFHNNTGTNGGGLEVVAYSNAEVIGVSVVGNSATLGGGLFADTVSGFLVVDGTFVENTATSSGGAFYFSNVGACVTPTTTLLRNVPDSATCVSSCVTGILLTGCFEDCTNSSIDLYECPVWNVTESTLWTTTATSQASSSEVSESSTSMSTLASSDSSSSNISASSTAPTSSSGSSSSHLGSATTSSSGSSSSHLGSATTSPINTTSSNVTATTGSSTSATDSTTLPTSSPSATAGSSSDDTNYASSQVGSSSLSLSEVGVTTTSTIDETTYDSESASSTGPTAARLVLACSFAVAVLCSCQ